MLDLQELQTLAQLIDNVEIALEKLEKSYSDKDSKDFNNSKKEILNFQKKISDMIG